MICQAFLKFISICYTSFVKLHKSIYSPLMSWKVSKTIIFLKVNQSNNNLQNTLFKYVQNASEVLICVQGLMPTLPMANPLKYLNVTNFQFQCLHLWNKDPVVKVHHGPSSRRGVWDHPQPKRLFISRFLKQNRFVSGFKNQSSYIHIYEKKGVFFSPPR